MTCSVADPKEPLDNLGQNTMADKEKMKRRESTQKKTWANTLLAPWAQNGKKRFLYFTVKQAQFVQEI